MINPGGAGAQSFSIGWQHELAAPIKYRGWWEKMPVGIWEYVLGIHTVCVHGKALDSNVKCISGKQ